MVYVVGEIYFQVYNSSHVWIALIFSIIVKDTPKSKRKGTYFGSKVETTFKHNLLIFNFDQQKDHLFYIYLYLQVYFLCLAKLELYIITSIFISEEIYVQRRLKETRV